MIEQIDVLIGGLRTKNIALIRDEMNLVDQVRGKIAFLGPRVSGGEHVDAPNRGEQSSEIPFAEARGTTATPNTLFAPASTQPGQELVGYIMLDEEVEMRDFWTHELAAREKGKRMIGRVEEQEAPKKKRKKRSRKENRWVAVANQ
ncbi:hypothetical protein HAX54_051379 [Datura stramonium]|uniref:Uncharacterized protein n=1 Tax=Datura stramonium TaxID=4076 RepID=A0ABS8SXM5_DATST|nr:hypothetical protein [Datura stramonium]